MSLTSVGSLNFTVLAMIDHCAVVTAVDRAKLAYS